MSFTVLASVIAFFYFTIWFCDSIFKSCMHYPYYAFLQGTGIHIGFLHVVWTTTSLNRIIFKWSQRASRFLQEWFTIGYIITVFIFLPLSLWILLKTSLFYLNNEHSPQAESSAVLTAVIPGINVPASEMISYIMALIISSFIHELGHAMSAVQEDVQVISMSVLLALVFPIAYVKLNSEHLANIAVKKRLKILCAGIWHNVILALLAFLILKSTPMLFSFAYSTGENILVIKVGEKSPLIGENGLHNGDIISNVNGCKVNFYKEWSNCLSGIIVERFGFCISNDFISAHDEMVSHTYKENDLIDCCSKDEKHSLCFEYIEPEDGTPSLDQYSCLKPRKILEHGMTFCTERKKYKCPTNYHCLKPILGNNTYFHIISRKGKEPVLYIGHPNDIYSTVKVSQYTPNGSTFKLISPDDFEQALYYIMSISLGLAFLNSLPCYGFDGYHITYSLIQLYANKYDKSAVFVNTVSICIIFTGTIVTVPVLIVMFYKTFFY